MKIDLNTSLKNNKHENSLTKTMTNNEYKIYPRSKVVKLINDFIKEHKLDAEFVNSPCEGLEYVRFVVEEEEEEDE